MTESRQGGNWPLSYPHTTANPIRRSSNSATGGYSHFSGAPKKPRPTKYVANILPGSHVQSESKDKDWEAVHEMFLTGRPRFIRQAYAILRNQEDAEDAVQDAFLSAYRYLRTFEGRSAFTTWFTRIVFNASLMIRRKRRNSRLDSGPDSIPSDDTSWIERIPASEPDPETVYLRAQTFQFVHALVEKMSPTLRQAFTMAYYKEMSCAEAAAQLGIKTATFKARLFRARQHLIDLVNRSLIASGRDEATRSSCFPLNDEIQAFPAALTETLPGQRAFSMTEPIQSVLASQGAK
jgi:RNA polymerase sigma-70 factor, ECF subfamily